MSGPSTRQGWASQPTYPVGIDLDNPLSRNLAAAYAFEMRGFDAANNFNLTNRTAPQYAVGRFGTAWGGTRASFAKSPNAFTNSGAGDPLSIETWVYSKNNDTSQDSIVQLGRYSGPDFARQFVLHTNIVSSGDIYLAHNGADLYTGSGAMPANAWTHIVYSYAGGAIVPGITLYVNGVSVSLTLTGSNFSLNLFQDDGIKLAHDDNSTSRYFRGDIATLKVWRSRALTQADTLSLYQNTWQVFAQRRRRIYTTLGTSAGRTGTSNQTLAQFQGSATTGVRVSATSAQTLAAIAGSTSAAVRVSATSLATLRQFTGSTTTAVRVTGTSAATLAALAGTASTAVRISGTSTITLGGLLGSTNGIVGTAPAIGTSTITLAAFSGSSSAAVRVTATAAIDLSAFAGSASGALGVAPRLGSSDAALAQFIGFTVGAVTGTPIVNTAGAITGGRSSVSMSRPRQSAMRRPRMN